jgi:CcmD family protein
MRLQPVLRAFMIAAVLLVFGGIAPVVTAQQTPASQDGYVPIDQLQPKEELPATPLVAAAYGVAWAAVLFYVWSVWRRLNQVERELAEVNRRLQPGARK